MGEWEERGGERQQGYVGLICTELTIPRASIDSHDIDFRSHFTTVTAPRPSLGKIRHNARLKSLTEPRLRATLSRISSPPLLRETLCVRVKCLTPSASSVDWWRLQMQERRCTQAWQTREACPKRYYCGNAMHR